MGGKHCSQVGRLSQFKEEMPEKWQPHFQHVNLIAKFQETMSAASWYDEYMFHRRLSGAASRGLDVSRIMLDGNMKLNGKVCGRPVAELTECPELGLYTATPCSCAPLFGKRRCAEHDLSGPWDGEALGESVIVAHRRRRVRLKQASSLPYEVLLKPTDDVLGGSDAGVRGRWIPASKATERQLRDHWLSQEPTGYVTMPTPADSFGGLECQTSKESSKEFKRLVRQGRFGGVLVAVTSCGYILHVAPFVGAETVPLRYFFVCALKCLGYELRVSFLTAVL